MKISRDKLAGIIKESIKRALLKEARAYAYETYCPYKREILSDEEYENLPDELRRVYDKEYQIQFTGRPWHTPERGEWMYSLGEPEESGVDDIQVTSDGGFSQDMQVVATISPEFAEKLQNDFDDWCTEHDDYNTKFEVDYEYPEYDD